MSNLISPSLSSETAAPVEPLCAVAERLAADFARSAARHDADDSFVAENYAALASEGILSAGVPRALGGGDASIAELCDMLRLVAHGCGSTALALSMHTHQVAIAAWRWHHTPARAAVEPLLRRVADEGLVLLSSGGSDWVGGSGTARREEGGYRIHARKIFGSGAPIGNVLMTSAVAEEEDGPIILHFAAPMAAAEIKLLDTWRTLGMRGTGSQDIAIDGLFVPDDKIALKRKAGEWHPLFQIIATIAFPLIYAVYLGTAEAARNSAVDIARKRPAAGRTTRLAGEMDTALFAARAAHRSMIAEAERNMPGEQSVNQIMMGRRCVEKATIRTTELAMELVGGAGFYRDTGLERRFRDIQAARYHPMQPETQFEYAGALALGLPVAHVF